MAKRRSLLEIGEGAASARAARVAREIVRCRACPRLVAWREEVARTKRAAYRDWDYWGRPVPGFGDLDARIVLVGLAPGAHGANRTGRMFTGDRSGDFLFAALHRAGLASQPTAVSREDGLALRDVFIVATVRCAPPGNKPLPDEIRNCARFVDAEIDLLPRARVALALGAIAWTAFHEHLARRGLALPRPRAPFAHGREASLGSFTLLGSYHVSQQNTQTGRLTPRMFDRVLARAKELAGR
jgi:uracil-DNA glycosylase family 4